MFSLRSIALLALSATLFAAFPVYASFPGQTGSGSLNGQSSSGGHHHGHHGGRHHANSQVSDGQALSGQPPAGISQQPSLVRRSPNPHKGNKNHKGKNHHKGNKGGQQQPQLIRRDFSATNPNYGQQQDMSQPPYNGPGPMDGPGPFNGPGPMDGPGPFNGPGPMDGPGPFNGPGPLDGPGPFNGGQDCNRPFGADADMANRPRYQSQRPRCNCGSSQLGSQLGSSQGSQPDYQGALPDNESQPIDATYGAPYQPSGDQGALPDSEVQPIGDSYQPSGDQGAFPDNESQPTGSAYGASG